MLVLAMLAACFAGGLTIMIARRVRSPRQAEKYAPWRFYFLLTLWCLVIPSLVFRRELLVAGVLALLALSEGYRFFFKQQSDQDADLNYLRHPGHCGRCAYDLSGNVNGICPECGWKIPGPSHRCEDPEWVHWWHGWEIAHLSNWPKTLANVGCGTIGCAAITVWAMTQGVDGISGMVLATTMCLHFLINTLRVIDYARRQRDTSGNEAGQGEQCKTE